MDPRLLRLAQEFIDRFELDLSGLNVLTEAASGAYLVTPLIAALAGAERVFAWTRDSSFGSAADVRAGTLDAARAWGVADRIVVAADRPAEHVAASDVITNSGFVRPIDAQMVESMKPTAVVPLMWETWEVRTGEVDLRACRRHQVLVLGTNETEPPCDMRAYAAALALKLLFDLGLELAGCRIILIGDQPSFGAPMCAALRAQGADVVWFGTAMSNRPTAPRPYAELVAYLVREGARADALLIAHHGEGAPRLGAGGVVSFEAIRRANPSLRVGVLSGDVDGAELSASGLSFLPPRIAPSGHQSYPTFALGPRPVLQLYSAGLKVGQEMGRARLAGHDLPAATRIALRRSPAMPFA